MVGVPGRSKGCNTCRRRKVKCDETRPECQRCHASGLQCEGYDRYPVFINRSAQGLHKRGRLEEVRPMASSSRAVMQSPLARLPGQISPSTMNMEVFVGHFIGSLLPSHLGSQLPWDSALWSQQAFGYAQPSNVMQQMKQALVETRFGRHSTNDTLFFHGKQMYGQALHSLQQAINDPQQSRADETLAAVRLMITFESYEATSQNADAWHNHLDGIAMLIRSRGPLSQESDFIQSLVADLRMSMMIQAIMRRRASFLADPEWQFHGKYEGDLYLQQITTCGFRLASLLERAETLSTPVTEQLQINELNDLMTAFLELALHIDSLHREMFRKQGADLACEICGVVPTPCASFRNQSPSEHHQPASPCRFFFMLSTLYALAVPLVATTKALYKPEWRTFYNLSDTQMTQLEFQTNTNRLQEIGQFILSFAEHCVHQELGMMYSRGIIFSLQGARWIFWGNVELSSKCRSMIEIVSSQRNVPFAKQVNIGEEHVPSMARKLKC